jgi:hypothetical protein
VSWRDEALEPQNERLRETDRCVARGRYLANKHGWQYRRQTTCASMCRVWDGTQLLFTGNAEEVLEWLKQDMAAASEHLGIPLSTN